MKFLRNLLAAILGSLIAFGILFVMFLVFITLVGNVDDTVDVRKNSVLELSFTEPISDYKGSDVGDPFAALFEEGVGLDRIIHAIKVAKEDDNIAGISMKI